jgi:hypothetical protein
MDLSFVYQTLNIESHIDFDYVKPAQASEFCLGLKKLTIFVQ